MKLKRPQARKLVNRIPGLDVELYSAPMTLGDLDKINAIKRKLDVSDDQLGTAIVITCIHMLTTRDGQDVFTLGDRRDLLECVPMGVLTDIANEIGDNATGGKKNS